MQGDLVDRISSNNSPDYLSYKDTLAQPLKLKDSLRIRDGLGSDDVRPLGWPQFKVTQLTPPDLSYLFVNNN